MLKHILILCLIIGFIDCSNRPTQNNRPVSLEQIVLTSNIPINSINYSHLSRIIGYRPFYLGMKADTIQINSEKLDSSYYYKDYDRYKFSNDSNQIRMFVDTTQHIPNITNIVAPPISLSYSDTFDFSKYHNHKSYPVYIENISLDTLNVGSKNGLPIHLEILAPNGNWIKTNKSIPGCGTDLIYFFIPPQGVLITPHPISHGTIKTKLRFAFKYKHKSYYSRFGYIYSNEFYGNIDSTFFEQKNIPF